ncbi:MAG TPA: response regulator transcription factor, partial [Chloroflexota bacterium]|nr:response regulator transcription factor [Chloroflexota bacterium]
MVGQAGAHRVLLLDKSVILRKALRALLERFHDLVVVGEANDDLEAVATMRTHDTDVLLMVDDVGVWDTSQAIENIRNEFSRVKIILVTGDRPDAQTVYRAMRAGVTGCISPDSETEDLVKAIHLVAHGQAVLSPECFACLVDLAAPPRYSSEQVGTMDRLSAREQEVFALVARGSTNRDIGRHLSVSESTVRSHMHSIRKKLRLTNRVQVATLALATR